MAPLQFQSFDDALAYLDRLTAHPPGLAANGWDLARALVHCAQSIECSMKGYPEAKGKAFQKTVGRLALNRFLSAGRMRHDLTAGIPGVPEEAMALPEAAERLKKAVSDFRGFEQPLAPHFAYGKVEKPEYERVHAMHLAEHLGAFTLP